MILEIKFGFQRNYRSLTLQSHDLLSIGCIYGKYIIQTLGYLPPPAGALIGQVTFNPSLLKVTQNMSPGA